MVLPKRYSRLLLGEGLFETMSVCNGQVVHAELYWQRLSHSAKLLKIPFHLSLADWLSQLSHIINQEKLEQGVVKAILIPIAEQRGIVVYSENSDIIWQVYEPSASKKSVSLLSLPWHRDSNNPMYRHKTLSYFDNIQAKRYAQSMARDDALIFDQHGHVLETSSANIFMVIHGDLYTPSLSLAILPGIKRHIILEQAKDLGFACFEQCLTRDHLHQADAIFLTNSLIGLLPVHQLDERYYDIEHTIYQLLKR